MPADYHTHTPLCRHAQGEPEEFIDAALAAGLTEYGISDHAPLTPEPYDDWRMFEAELPRYYQWIDRARARAADRMPVRSGLECDWLDGCEPWIEHLRGLHDWDYLIGSVHYLGAWDFDNPGKIEKWSDFAVEEVWENYWAAYVRMVESGLFDILGHPDLVKKFAHRPAGDLARYYEPVVDAIAASGSVIELNTAGWHKPCGEPYPASDFLRLACEAGVPLVLSSDAHAPEEVARDFAKAREVALAAGYRETVLIARGKRGAEPL